MNLAQVEHFRNLLIDWKQALMEEVERTVHHMQDEASHFPDPQRPCHPGRRIRP